MNGSSTIIDYVENSASRFGKKTAFAFEGDAITFAELRDKAMHTASFLVDITAPQKPVLILMEKCVDNVAAFLAATYAGCFYVPVDTKMPYLRVKKIIEILSAEIIIARKGDFIHEELFNDCKIYYIDELSNYDGNFDEVEKRSSRIVETDPLYAIFTSGSTGVPKGVLTSHRALTSFIDDMGERFQFSENDVFANQIPFYFDASTKDIYLTIKYGCTTHIIPQKLFLMPKLLVEFLNEKKVTCITWVPSLLCMLANFNVFKKYKPGYLKKVFFVGEVMPTKQYNIWKRNLPDVRYINLYGSTEVTGSSAYYEINRDIEDSEAIPIGNPFGNVDVFLLDEEDKLVTEENKLGEICVRGAALSLGYFREPEKTGKVFVQNPLHDNYPERIYRSGDIARYNEYHEIVYVCRKDFQIKRFGRRIELGEIEAVLSALDGIDRVCCLFEEKKQNLYLFYEGRTEQEEIDSEARKILPSYMIPSVYCRLDSMPLNANGKIDRVKLKSMMEKCK